MNFSANVRRNLASTMMMVVMVVFGMQYASADTTCVITGNVEVNISPETPNAPVVTFSFTNYNDYQVTVNVTFHLTDMDGNTKDTSKVFVVAQKAEREIKFNCNNLGMKTFKPADCGAEMVVQKCE